MGWKEERDALIAQTLAFVEQVTGKPVDFAQLAPPPPMPGSPARPAEPTSISIAPASEASGAEPVLATPASAIPEQDGAVADDLTELSADDESEPAPQQPAQEPIEANAPEFMSAEPGRPDTASFEAEPFKSPLSPGLAAQFGLQRNMQDEIRARIAKFRAHQERFNRERQEYFSATLARLRSSMEQSSQNDNT